MSFCLKSLGFDAGTVIPRDFSGEGKDISPPLEWRDPPLNTKEFALICEDPDAPRKEPWVHWVLYNIPASIQRLPENISKIEQPKEFSAMQGTNSWGRVGYSGPFPPRGGKTHHYHFKLYALDTNLKLETAATKEELLSAMTMHIIGETDLVGTYRRG